MKVTNDKDFKYFKPFKFSIEIESELDLQLLISQFKLRQNRVFIANLLYRFFIQKGKIPMILDFLQEKAKQMNVKEL